jgi:hypothetical protein
MYNTGGYGNPCSDLTKSDSTLDGNKLFEEGNMKWGGPMFFGIWMDTTK